MWSLLRVHAWPELRHHPWRSATAVLAVMLGVALAFAVHLINASALDEFSGAVRAVNGQADLSLQGASGALDESIYPRLALREDVAVAHPVLERSGYALGADGRRVAIRILGVDALVVAGLSPALMPQIGRAHV